MIQSVLKACLQHVCDHQAQILAMETLSRAYSYASIHQSPSGRTASLLFHVLATEINNVAYKHTYDFHASSTVQYGALYHCNCRSAVNSHLHQCIAHQAAWQSSKMQMGRKQRHWSLMTEVW
jgi:hypothetical protein